MTEEDIRESISINEASIKENAEYIGMLHRQLEEDARRKRKLYTKDSFKSLEDHFNFQIEVAEKVIKIRNLQLEGLTLEEATERVDQEQQLQLF